MDYVRWLRVVDVVGLLIIGVCLLWNIELAVTHGLTALSTVAIVICTVAFVAPFWVRPLRDLSDKIHRQEIEINTVRLRKFEAEQRTAAMIERHVADVETGYVDETGRTGRAEPH